jgi:hypothetical protein
MNMADVTADVPRIGPELYFYRISIKNKKYFFLTTPSIAEVVWRQRCEYGVMLE